MNTSLIAVAKESISTGLQAAARNYANGASVGEHCHGDGQFIYATTGVMEIRAARRLWLVPPQRALWVPPRLPHGLRARGAVSLRTVYLAPEHAIPIFGSAPMGFMVPPLVRELILRILDPRAADNERRRHLTAVLIDELAGLDREGLSLTIPSEPRLSHVCNAILAQPGKEHRIDSLAKEGGFSLRTLGRLARDELGCPLSEWRQQARVLSAVPMLVTGEPVMRVAQSLGYETPGAFAAMFRRIMGVSPRAYRKNEWPNVQSASTLPLEAPAA